MRILLSLALILVFGSVLSQEPPKQKPATVKGQAKGEQRGSEKSPLSIKGELVTKKDAAETKEDADERKEKREIDHALVKYTGLAVLVAAVALLVAAAQAGFFWRQLRLMREAVDDAYEIFRATHFPKLLVRRLRIPDPETTGSSTASSSCLAMSET